MLTPEIIATLLVGDRHERRRLYDRLLVPVTKTAHHVRHHFKLPAARHDDLVQDGMLYIYEDPPRRLLTWTPERASFDGYIRMITRRRLWRLLSRERPTRSFDEAEVVALDHRMPDSSMYWTLLGDEVLDWVSSGKETLRRRFTALFIDQCPRSEVAEVEGVSVEALHTWVSRFRKQLDREFPDFFLSDPSGQSDGAKDD